MADAKSRQGDEDVWGADAGMGGACPRGRSTFGQETQDSDRRRRLVSLGPLPKVFGDAAPSEVTSPDMKPLGLRPDSPED